MVTFNIINSRTQFLFTAVEILMTSRTRFCKFPGMKPVAVRNIQWKYIVVFAVHVVKYESNITQHSENIRYK